MEKNGREKSLMRESMFQEGGKGRESRIEGRSDRKQVKREGGIRKSGKGNREEREID